MKYHHEKIEAKWQHYWAENQTFAADNNSETRGEAELSVAKPKYYVFISNHSRKSVSFVLILF